MSSNGQEAKDTKHAVNKVTKHIKLVRKLTAKYHNLQNAEDASNETKYKTTHIANSSS